VTAVLRMEVIEDDGMGEPDETPVE